MQVFWTGGGPGGFWFGPALLGVLLILLGILLYIVPQLLAYVVAGIFIISGSGLLATAWRMRQQITYRRIERDDDSPNFPFQ